MANKIEHTCKQCGTKYYNYKENSNFCSNDCKKKYINVDYKCDYCGTIFTTKRSKVEKISKGERQHLYCSKECANNAKYTSVVRVCKNCGKEYTVMKSSANIAKFCSRFCYTDYKNTNSVISTHRCPICNKEFKTYHHDQIYCSLKCSGISQQKRIVCRCDMCGKEFNRIESEVIKNDKHFCSNECRNEYRYWNKNDIEILIRNYKVLSYSEISKLLSRDVSAKGVSSKAIALGLTTSREWADEETNIIIANYSKIPMSELMNMLPNRTLPSIMGKARTMGLLSYFYLTNIYSNEEDQYLRENYLLLNNKQLAEHLNRTENGISIHLNLLGLHRPLEKHNYENINNYVRHRLSAWKTKIREENGYTCEVTGKHNNIIVHHIYGFNLLIGETIDILDFPIYDDMDDYSQEELDNFFNKFMELQELHGEYVCITEPIHKLFHKEYGYGNNNASQWNEFVSKYKNGYYINVA